MALWVKYVLHNCGTQVWILSTHHMNICKPNAGRQKQEDPWVILVNHSSQMANLTQCLKTQKQMLLSVK